MFARKIKCLAVLLAMQLAFCAGILSCSYIAQQPVAYASETEQQIDQYTLYIGLSDKDTHKQEISTEKARDKVNAIVIKHAPGYTCWIAKGGWTDEKGQIVEENTLVYTLTDVKEEQVKAIMDEVIIALNQSSIMVQRASKTCSFYDGK